MNTLITTEQLFDLLDRKTASGEPLVIAVDGRCASGKTTLAEYLKNRYDARLFHMDDYFLRPEQRTPERFQEPGGNVDRERFLSEVLTHLEDRGGLMYQSFDCQEFCLKEPVHVPYHPVTVIEGSYAMRPELRGYYDISVFMDIDEETQKERILKREGAEGLQMFVQRWIPLEETYFNTLNIRDHCDYRIYGNKEMEDKRMTQLTEEFVKNMPKLGFGLMRLPRLEDGKTIDVEQVKVMTDAFLDAGMRYFDTAFVYEGSEEACRKALVERHPRESYYLATKLNAGMPGLTEETAKQEFFTSLERTGAQYFDFYLLHAIGKRNLPNYNDWGIWEFAQEQKAKGLIKHVGFSFHDTPELLEEVLTAHPEAEFVQLQINYADWNNPSVQSRRCYEVARKFNKPVVVMEPIKGGMLAVPPVPVKEVLQAANPDVSCASWAVRYVASKEGILVVLSGMSNVEQMEDNLSYMKNFQPLSEEEAAVVAKAQAALEAIPSIPCTGCRYCVAGCPMQINIPSIFSAMNHKLIYDNDERAKSGYANATRGDNGKASSCIKCGACEAQCPQHLQIRDLLEQAVEMFGE